MVDEAQLVSGYEVVVENRVPHALIMAFEADVRELDPAALAPGTFWANEIVRLREGTDRFESLRKHQFKLVGQLCEEEEALPFVAVTITADVSALRAVAAFLTECAEGIEKRGSQWEHAHLRDAWSEWYSAYPDIVVVRSY